VKTEVNAKVAEQGGIENVVSSPTALSAFASSLITEQRSIAVQNAQSKAATQSRGRTSDAIERDVRQAEKVAMKALVQVVKEQIEVARTAGKSVERIEKIRIAKPAVVIPEASKNDGNQNVPAVFNVRPDSTIADSTQQGERMGAKVMKLAVLRQTSETVEQIQNVEIVDEIHLENHHIMEDCETTRDNCCLHDVENDAIVNGTLHMTTVSAFDVGSWVVVCDRGKPVVKQNITDVVDDETDARYGEYVYQMTCWRENKWDSEAVAKYADEDMECGPHTAFVGSVTVINEQCLITLPAHLGWGDCSDDGVLGNGESCTPTCPVGYDTVIDYYCATGDSSDAACLDFQVSGDSEVQIEAGTSYNDAGATCSDYVLGSLSVVTTSDVDNAQIGNYTVTYNCSGSLKQRAVSILDTTAPSVVISGTLELTVQPLSVYVDEGAVCSDVFDSAPALSSSSNVDTNVQGTYTVTYTCTDASGNSAQDTRTVYVLDTIDNCASSPCQNGATCTDAVNAYECDCTDGWSGTVCTDNLRMCTVPGTRDIWVDGGAYNGPPFYNFYFDSACTQSLAADDNGDYPLIAGANYVFRRCGDATSHPFDVDNTLTTGITGTQTLTLTMDTPTKTWRCTSHAHMEGDFVAVAYEPCNNHGTCTDGVNTYECACDAGYNGTLCQNNIDECATAPCQNGGQCNDLVNDYVCTCDAGFSGDTCGDCAEGKGFNGTHCVPCAYPTFNDQVSQTAACTNQTCPQGFGVQTDIASWDTENHENNCVQCDPGYDSPAGTGQCVDIDECAGDPCVHGNCTNHVNSYACACEPGWSGTDCDQNIDECAAPSPCLNGANCTDLVNGYVCDCVAGFEGEQCATNIDECAYGLCQNGATCTDAINNYTCSCAPGWKGRNCEHVDYCPSGELEVTIDAFKVCLDCPEVESHYMSHCAATCDTTSTCDTYKSWYNTQCQTC
jgi:Notch-like protein